MRTVLQLNLSSRVDRRYLVPDGVVRSLTTLFRPLFLPPFSLVVKQLFVVVSNGELLPPLATSLYRTAAGLLIAGALCGNYAHRQFRTSTN